MSERVALIIGGTGQDGAYLAHFLLGKGYRVLQVENRAVNDYREKIFGSETKTDDADARLMARMGFLHECERRFKNGTGAGIKLGQ